MGTYDWNDYMHMRALYPTAVNISDALHALTNHENWQNGKQAICDSCGNRRKVVYITSLHYVCSECYLEEYPNGYLTIEDGICTHQYF